MSGTITVCATFPLGDPLSSTDSAAGVPVLFARFAGTMGPCDFPPACMSALPSETFADRSESDDSETDEISRFSRLECCRMLRFSDSAASAGVSPVATPAMWPSPCQDKVGTRKW